MRDELTMAESANTLLRESLKTTAGVVGDEAKRRAVQLREHVEVARHNAEAVRRLAPYHLGMGLAVRETDQLVQEASHVLRHLEEAGRYHGPRRGQMSISEKAAFIRERGEDAFLALPE
jgi:hypothetical protein